MASRSLSNKLLGGGGENDPIARVVVQMSQFNDGLEAIGQGLVLSSVSKKTNAGVIS
jgi:hypothetical protein